MTVTPNFGMHQRALVFFKFTAQHRLEGVFKTLDRDISNKTQTALVDTNERYIVFR